MSVYRSDAAGVTARGPGEPCDHRHRVAYTDESGLYSRCAVCGTEFLDGVPEIDAQPRMPVACERCNDRGSIAVGGQSPDHWGNYDTEDCPVCCYPIPNTTTKG